MHQTKADNSRATQDNFRRNSALQTNRRKQLAANVQKKYEPLDRSVCISPIAGKFSINDEMAKQPKPKACNVQKPGNLAVSCVFNQAIKLDGSAQKNRGLQIRRHTPCVSNAIIA